MHGESVSVFATIYNWVNEFKCGCTSTKVEHCLGCPVEVSTPEMINIIHNIVLNDRRIKLGEIVEATGVSKAIMVSILHDKWDMRKISVRWVSCLLSAENKRNRVVASEALLVHIHHNLNEFLCQFVTVDETWIHQETIKAVDY